MKEGDALNSDGAAAGEGGIGVDEEAGIVVAIGIEEDGTFICDGPVEMKIGGILDQKIADDVEIGESGTSPVGSGLRCRCRR